MTYPEIKAGAWIYPKRKGYQLACCDCGLVHTVNFRIRKGKTQFQLFRDEHATRQLRKAGKKE